MINILGMKRIMILAVLLGINILLGASVYLYLIPHNEDQARQLQTLTSQAKKKRADVIVMQTQYQTIQDQKVAFANLKNQGFLTDQNRAVARQRMDQIQKFTNILTAKYSVGAASVTKTPAATDAGYVILDSPVKIDVEAMDDVDFYNFVYWVENAFPGHVSVNNLSLNRVLDVNDATLRQIGNGVETVLVKGTVGFDWDTMIPASQAIETPELKK